MAAFTIGPHPIEGRVVFAPMAGLSDAPTRRLARRHGAAMAVSEMATSDVSLWNSRKSATRLPGEATAEPAPVVTQIAGSEPAQLAEAAAAAAGLGADIVDINMGCPAKKVCRKLAGSALLKDEKLVGRILDLVKKAVDVPVTVKIRTGESPTQRNAVSIARIAEAAGLSAITVHGRTRECRFQGPVEYDTIRAVRDAVDIPVIANGDIDGPDKAARVLKITGADAVMVGRAAIGRPWIFDTINAWIAGKIILPAPPMSVRRDIILGHLDELYELYGEARGVRLARKHLSGYCQYLEGADELRRVVVRVESADAQKELIHQFFDAIRGGDPGTSGPTPGEPETWLTNQQARKAPAKRSLRTK